METSKRRSYTKEQRDAAVADVPALGVMGAAKKHGIPQSCVSQWAKRAGVRRETTPAPSPARRTLKSRVAKLYSLPWSSARAMRLVCSPVP